MSIKTTLAFIAATTMSPAYSYAQTVPNMNSANEEEIIEDPYAYNTAFVNTHLSFSALLDDILEFEKEFDPTGYVNAPFNADIARPYLLPMKDAVGSTGNPNWKQFRIENPYTVCSTIGFQQHMQKYASELKLYLEMVSDTPVEFTSRLDIVLKQIEEFGSLNQKELDRLTKAPTTPLLPCAAVS